jgi:hypothetical protein
MDMSKLPRLSRTDPPPAGAPDSGEPGGTPGGPPGGGRRNDSGERRSDPYGYGDDPPSFLMEAWISIGLGLLLLLVCPNTLKFWSSRVFHTHFAPYVHIENGEQSMVDYATLEDSNGRVVATVPYRSTTPDLSPNFWSDLVVTVFALALLAEGIALVFSRKPPVILLALVITILATLANLIFTFVAGGRYGALATFYPIAAGVLLPIAPVAILVGGYMAFSQWRLYRWRVVEIEPPTAAPAAPADPTAALLGKVLGGEPKARCTHYKFAHQALRQAAMENPAKCVGLLQSPSAQRFLNDLWQAVRTGCTQAAEPGQAPEPLPTGLEADMTQVGPYSAVIVTLPKPQFPTEAHYVALVLRSYVRAGDGLTIERHPLLLYYTLEHGGAREDGSPRTVLAEWQAGTHLSYGDGPTADASAFRDAVREKVALLEKREDEAAGKTAFA